MSESSAIVLTILLLLLLCGLQPVCYADDDHCMTLPDDCDLASKQRTRYDSPTLLTENGIDSNKKNNKNDNNKREQEVYMALVNTAAAAAAPRFPAIFLFHGGGPMPLLNDPAHHELVASWSAILRDVLQTAQRPPKAIVVVSAHYNTPRGRTGVGAAAKPSMLYDYGGFPPESFQFQYPAPGHPALAEDIVKRIQAVLGRADAAVADPRRPFDHGVFVPLMKLFPEASIPVVCVSVMEGDHADEHLVVGRALAPLREAPHDVLIIGSGSSMHHFGNLFNGPKGSGTKFNKFLTATLTAQPEERTGAADAAAASARAARLETLKGILSFPGIEEAHPAGQAEHLMPLLTVAGAAEGGPATEVSNLEFLQANVRQYVFS